MSLPIWKYVNWVHWEKLEETIYLNSTFFVIKGSNLERRLKRIRERSNLETLIVIEIEKEKKLRDGWGIRKIQEVWFFIEQRMAKVLRWPLANPKLLLSWEVQAQVV